MDIRAKNRLFAMLATLLFSTAAAGAGSSSDVTFDQLDMNKDGLLTAVEASENDGLSSMWTEADQDENGAIDRAEFSAFEAMPEQEGAPGATSPGATNPGSGGYK